MHPLLGLPLPSATGSDDVQVWVVLTISPVCLNNHNIAALEGFATDLAKELIQALDTAFHEGTEQDVSVLIKRRP